MKIIFFLALLANLVFFLWQYNAGAFHHAADNVELSVPKVKQILLLSEQEKKPPVTVATIQTTPPVATHLTTSATVVAPAAVSPIQTPVPVVTSAPMALAPVKNFYCYQVNGFTDKTAVTRWAQQQALDKTPLQIKEAPPVVADYLVNYPAAATLTESRKNIATLKTHGIYDFFMINNGEFKGAISLGVFKNEARAIKAQQVLIQKGITAKVTKRYKTAASVSTQIKTDKTKPQLLATLTGHARQPSVELLSKCE